MKAIIFNGALERRSFSTSNLLSRYIKSGLENFGIESHIFDLADSGIPLFDCTLTRIPNGVQVMNNLFREADIHFWLAPLYHGSIPGVMKTV
ncbi:NADPH-dependent FMN reductase [Sphingobacterium sp. JUb56]|uniref:NADPH-dependent FMN reductase n=1 Tax=Sphingobacterium sp. JUb56 TaxID=2587145 RepID=UPI001814F2FF|nr:NAD(P)H-dependent oxidoreductase [Sphingobacterium sp. JUb56]MBB2949450.1 NAD(P)H-dependent FMN reductase [Sphingobacterium sp. JUb56]